MIMLSTTKITHNIDIIFPIMGFWSTTLNFFVFPRGMLTPIVLDVMAITGLLASGKVLHVDPDFPDEGLEYTHDTSFQSLLSWNAKTFGDVTDVEHNAFFMYFFNKYFYITNSLRGYKRTSPLYMYAPLRSRLLLGPFFLGSSLQRYGEIIEESSGARALCQS